MMNTITTNSTKGLKLLWLMIIFSSFMPKSYSQDLASRYPGKEDELSGLSGNVVQEKNIRTLKNVLTALESKYDVSIIANNELLEGKKVNYNQGYSNVEDALNGLLKDLNMKYDKVRDKFYVILPADEGKKNSLEKIKIKLSRDKEGSASLYNPFSKANDQYVARLQAMVKRLEPKDIPVKGKVTSEETGEPIPGVNILIMGSTIGTVSDIDGNYTINAPEEGTLVFSFIGYTTEEVPVSSRSVIDVAMATDIQSLEEVVVVGYGTVDKSDVTGSIVSLSDEELNKGLNTSVDQLMQGRAPGVQITQSSAAPGGGVSIRIRGSGSINGSNEPLYVIDGLPIDNSPAVTQRGEGFNGNPPPRNPLNSLNPADVESIEILKDASATAIYGSRGANGVILITTKKGAEGKLMVDYNTTLAISKVARKIEVLNTSDYIKVMNELAIARGDTPPFDDTAIQDIGNGTDWQEEVFRNATTHTHNLSLSGGSDKTTFFTSFNYTNQEGVVINSAFERFQGRINLEHQASKKFKFGINLNTALLLNDYVPVNGFGINQQADLINSALNVPPVFPVLNEDGSYSRPEGGQIVSVTLDNPVARANGELGEEKTNRTFGNIFGEYTITPDLVFRLNFGSDRSNSRRDVYNSTLTNIGSASNGIATIATGELSNYLLEGIFNYRKNINDQHDLNMVAGYTFQQFDDRTFSGNIRGFASDVVKTNNLGLGDTELDELGSNTTQRRLLSYLGRINYGFRDKYLFTASIRADGSSNFGENNRFGIFPSFSVAWRMINEEFLKSSRFVSDLKLRVGWGQIGNDNIGIGNTLRTFARVNNIFSGAVFGESLYTAISPVRIPNPDLRWEATEQLNAGVDYGLFSGRLYSSIDIFVKTTKDLLLDLPIPNATGFNFITSNVGEVRNSGFEFLLSSKNLTRNFIWNTSFNFATLKNEVISLGPIPEIVSNAAGTTVIARPGDPLFSYYGFESEGIFQTQEDVDASAQSSVAAPGVPKWKDLNNDGRIDGNDRTLLGNPFPDLTWGLNNDFEYNDFSLSIFIEGVHGVDLFNWALVDAHIANDPFRNRLAEPLLNRWTPENPTNEWPSAVNTSQYQGGNVNSYTITDASYIRLKNVQLTYRIPIGDNKLIRNASVYVTGQNLALISDYPGYDPDVNSTGTGNVRLDRNAYPAARTFLIGLNVQL